MAPRIDKKFRPFIRSAVSHGARLENGKKHLKIYDGDELVTVLSYGSKAGYEGRGDNKALEKIWRTKGWA